MSPGITKRSMLNIRPNVRVPVDPLSPQGIPTMFAAPSTAHTAPTTFNKRAMGCLRAAFLLSNVRGQRPRRAERLRRLAITVQLDFFELAIPQAPDPPTIRRDSNFSPLPQSLVGSSGSSLRRLARVAFLL